MVSSGLNTPPPQLITPLHTAMQKLFLILIVLFVILYFTIRSEFICSCFEIVNICAWTNACSTTYRFLLFWDSRESLLYSCVYRSIVSAKNCISSLICMRTQVEPSYPCLYHVFSLPPQLQDCLEHIDHITIRDRLQQNVQGY